MHQLVQYGSVLGSVLGGNYEAYVHGDRASEYPGGSDTGMGWAYLRHPHTAATAWTGLMLLQANPFAPPVQPVPGAAADDVQAPARDRQRRPSSAPGAVSNSMEAFARGACRFVLKQTPSRCGAS